MEVKGTAFLARKAMLAREIGEGRTAEIIGAFQEKHPDFPTSVIATTTMPVELFIAFNDMLVATVYGGDVQSYWRFGEKSADWALTSGPYKHLLATKGMLEFAESARLLYPNYFTVGRAESRLRGENVVEIRIVGIPQQYRHVYFEYAIVAYFKRGLELTGARAVTAERRLGFSKGDAEVHYDYILASASGRSVNPPASGR
jgi:hypothetical protein